LNYNKKTGLLIILSTLLRLAVAAKLELGNDEVYYQAYALHLQWNYFDHPPLVALLIRFSTFNLFFQQEIFIRLGPIICAAAGTWIIFRTGTLLKNQRTGWIAAILYNTSFYSSIIAGTFILPDSTHVLFWLLSLYLMVHILKRKQNNSSNTLYFILLGICTGLCIMSKVQGIFLWVGFGGYAFFHHREFLKSPLFWLSIALCSAIIFPIFWWNYENHFITYHYHGSRIGLLGKPDIDHLLQQILGSVFYNNPVNIVFYIIGLAGMFKLKYKQIPESSPLLLWVSFPLIGVLIWFSLFNDTLPHWSGPAYLSLMLLCACILDEQMQAGHGFGWLKTSAWVYGSIVVLGMVGILYSPFNMVSKRDGKLGTGDPTLDLEGWKSFASTFENLYREDVKRGKMKSGSVILSDYWFPAGHLDHYLCIPYDHNLIAVGTLNNIHHFAWLNHRRPRIASGSDAYFIYPSNYYGPPDVTLKSRFAWVEDSLQVPQFRSGVRVRNFVVYRMHDFRGDSLDYLIPGIR
jgi:hypothetical protein